MDLTAADFEQLAKRSQAAPRPQDDRRQATRLLVDARATVLPRVAGVIGTPSTIHLYDISAIGIGIRYPHPIGSGQEFFVRLPRLTSMPLWLHCVVVHSRPDGEEFVVGARIKTIVDLSQAQPLSPPSAIARVG